VEDGSINLDSIISSSREIGEILKMKNDYHLVIIKSTVTPGTTENIVKPILEKKSGKRCGLDFGLCMNPEFLREGSAIDDMYKPDRIIIGEFDEKSGSKLNDFYQNFYDFKIPILRVNLSTAEMIKYANNSFLAAKISFINQIANICQKIPGSDVTKISEALGLDKRINPNFLRAGLGYGGSCFPKDLDALINYAKNLNINVDLLEAVKKVNSNQPYVAIEIAKLFLKKLKNKKISILGLSFKPETDDIRNAVSIKIIKKLIEEEALITVYDPVATSKTREIFKEKINYAPSSMECVQNSDCCILVTEWEEFRKLTPEFYLKNMRNPMLIDGRRLYNPKIFTEKLKYVAVGLG
jgi:UDPglucose 6-dehydrogenase